MSSLDPVPTTLSDHLRQLGLVHTATELNDLVARATQKRWSPVVLLEQLAQAELDARLRHRVERRLRDARLGRFKSMADWEWDWPKTLHRPALERVLSLDFLTPCDAKISECRYRAVTTAFARLVEISSTPFPDHGTATLSCLFSGKSWKRS